MCPLKQKLTSGTLFSAVLFMMVKKEIPTGFVPANVSYKAAVLFCSAAALRRFYLFVECVLPAKAAFITVVGAERRLEAAL